MIDWQSLNIFLQLTHNNQQMGICNKPEVSRQINYSTKAALNIQNYENMSFYFTTQNILRLDGDCLIVYCDQQLNLGKNVFLQKVGKKQTKKIKEYANAQLQTTKAKIIPGQIITFPLSIPTLRFKYISLICLKMWDGHEKIKINMTNIFTNLFKQLQKLNIKSIAITQFNQNFGIPTQVGCKLLAQAFSFCRSWLEIVTIIFNDSNSQSYYMQKIVQFKPDDRTSMIRSSTMSNYY